MHVPTHPAPRDPAFWLERARHDELTLLLDLDGTLIPFADSPEEADLDRAAITLLDRLARAGVRVVIVSGRPQPQVERLRPTVEHCWWVAEHGLWRRADGDWQGPDAPASELESLEVALVRLMAVPGVRIERKSRAICLHWRRVARESRESVIANAELVCDEWLEAHPEYERIEGVEMLEVRHVSANKGAAVRWVRELVPDAFLIAIGDDETDEDMFAALHDDELAIGVRNFRHRRSRARVWLSGPSAVRELLGWILDTRAGVTRPPPFEPAAGDEGAVSRVAARARLVVVSNRAPTQVAAGRHRSVGGLVSALEPALRTYDGIWLGWSGQQREGTPILTIEDDVQPTRATFDFPPRWRERFYSGFCNRALWPLFHGFPGRVNYADVDWEAYVEANDAYARFAAQLVEPDGTVWVHDYHLLLVGKALRRLGYGGPMGLFLHVPFPPPDLLDTLPWRDPLLAGMCAFDLVGFHTEQWADNFRACVANGDTQTLPEIGVLPIGIDPVSFAAVRGSADREVMGLRAVLGPRRMILGVDRLDYAKGVPERLIAFEHLLEGYPEWRGEISFVQVSVPSREDVPEYEELRRKVENLVGRINGRFGEADWVPVRYLYRSYDHRVLAQLYRMADVALVTPLRDGLNLVAKEFVAAQDTDHPGVLVLSRFAGAAVELSDALLTNPYHPDGLAIDIDRALRMPIDERRRRHALLAATINQTTPERWAAMFLERLCDARPSSS